MTGIITISSAMGLAPGGTHPDSDIASQVAAATAVQQSSMLAPAVVISADSDAVVTFQRAAVGSVAAPPPPPPVTPASTGTSPSSSSSSSSSPSTPDPESLPSKNFDVAAAVKAAKDEIGKSQPTGFGQPGECINAVHRWILAGKGNWTGVGTPIDNYVGAHEVKDLKNAAEGDVIQFWDPDHPKDWVAGVHTVLVVKNNGDGTLDIIQSNAPAGSGLVSEVTKWTPDPPKGLIYKIFRF